MYSLRSFITGAALGAALFVSLPALAEGPEAAPPPPLPVADTPAPDMAVPGLPLPAGIANNASSASFPAPAGPAVSAKTAASANEIADINERLAVLTARLAELELQARIAAKLAEIDKVNGKGAAGPFGAGDAPVPEADVFVPSVKEISGVDGNLRAALYVQGGNTQVVRVGDRIGIWRIKDIQIDSVVVESGGQDMRLGFGAYTSNPSASSPGRR